MDRYPEHLEVDTRGDQATLAPRADSDPDSMPDFFNDLGLSEPVDSLDTDVVEQQLVPAARKKLAMDRQQVLLSLVLMGINRLVVSDGSIKASVVFQLATTDRVAKKRTRVYDYNRTSNEKYSRSRWGWIFSPSTSYSEDATTSIKVNTVRSDDSEAKVDLKTKLTGDVSVRFRSETFPLERMTEVLGVPKPEEPRRPAPAPAAAIPGARHPAALADDPGPAGPTSTHGVSCACPPGPVPVGGRPGRRTGRAGHGGGPASTRHPPGCGRRRHARAADGRGPGVPVPAQRA